MRAALRLRRCMSRYPLRMLMSLSGEAAVSLADVASPWAARAMPLPYMSQGDAGAQRACDGIRPPHLCAQSRLRPLLPSGLLTRAPLGCANAPHRLLPQTRTATREIACLRTSALPCRSSRTEIRPCTKSRRVPHSLSRIRSEQNRDWNAPEACAAGHSVVFSRSTWRR